MRSTVRPVWNQSVTHNIIATMQQLQREQRSSWYDNLVSHYHNQPLPHVSVMIAANEECLLVLVVIG